VNGEDKPIKYSRLITASPIDYGWVVLAAGTLGMLMTMPGQTVGVSVFLDPIIADLGVPRSLVSLLYMVGTLTGALALPWIGRWIDRVGRWLPLRLSSRWPVSVWGWCRG